MTWRASVLTLFPELFPGPLDISVTGRGLAQGLWEINPINIRDFAPDKHCTVDDTPFGGGPGMVMRPDVLDRALQHSFGTQKPGALIYLSPKGTPLTQKRVKELAKLDHVGLLCGRFEGVDQRVLDEWDFEEISIGDYVLSGGELAAMVLLDACARLLPGVLKCESSLEEESFSHGLLEYPQYTRPQNWQGRDVPDVLISGHHGKVRQWRHEQACERTRTVRPDLWARYEADHEDEKGFKK